MASISLFIPSSSLATPFVKTGRRICNVRVALELVRFLPLSYCLKLLSCMDLARFRLDLTSPLVFRRFVLLWCPFLGMTCIILCLFPHRDLYPWKQIHAAMAIVLLAQSTTAAIWSQILEQGYFWRVNGGLTCNTLDAAISPTCQSTTSRHNRIESKVASEVIFANNPCT